MTSQTVQQAAPKARPAPKTEWAPRMWQGCDFFAWMRLLVRNCFAVNWRYWYVAIVVTIVSFMHTLLRFVQQAIYGRRIAATPIR
ncbi:MAG TPA: hypothetical protein VGY66_07720, partial [Gemmataceae bacterium]|nr:hypothetical protein [Gemmataceae bacterium]